MGSRGTGFALGQPERRDEAGHSLPSGVFMHFVALEVACKACAGRGVETVLGTWAIETREPAFDSRQVHERGNNSAVQVEEIVESDGSYRRRYKMCCPRCGATPVVREDKVDAGLEAMYEPGTTARTRRIYL